MRERSPWMAPVTVLQSHHFDSRRRQTRPQNVDILFARSKADRRERGVTFYHAVSAWCVIRRRLYEGENTTSYSRRAKTTWTPDTQLIHRQFKDTRRRRGLQDWPLMTYTKDLESRRIKPLSVRTVVMWRVGTMRHKFGLIEYNFLSLLMWQHNRLVIRGW